MLALGAAATMLTLVVAVLVLWALGRL
jgi:hypothetical protein